MVNDNINLKTCGWCKYDFPEHLMAPIHIGEGPIDVCPICALRIRNKIHGFPIEELFQGEKANEMYEEAIAFAERYIPEGIYCYYGTRAPGDPNYKSCPFWDIDRKRPHQDNGFCRLCHQGDWEGEGIGLIWDEVKECGINENLEEEED